MSKFNKGTEYIVLDSVAAAAGDLDFNAGAMTFGNTTVGTVKVIHKRIVNGKAPKQIKVAETAQVRTGTITAADDTDFWVTLVQDIDGKIYSKKYIVDSGTGATDESIADDLRAQIAADSFIRVTGSGTTTLVLTGDSGYPRFQASASSNISLANTTPGVTAKNTGALLDADGFEVTTSNNYTSYTFFEEVPTTGANPNVYVPEMKKKVVFINEGDGDAADLVTAIDNALTADDGAGVADPDAIAVA